MRWHTVTSNWSTFVIVHPNNLKFNIIGKSKDIKISKSGAIKISEEPDKILLLKSFILFSEKTEILAKQKKDPDLVEKPIIGNTNSFKFSDFF